ncbi:hypothetical protein DICVIV_03436 [Dictyocaulus viviparus]|uniref:Uncharacterized protein n=1 Tax=Dictyocaulus viviparus TaxID=29172 RepID=A0A0D8Y161_DICVI|nr:hypothetical protein DICVIV_03436 [Dictyocaulus viviparus]
MSQLDADRGFNSTERAMLSVEGVGLSNARGLEHIGANISPYHMKDYSKLMQDKTNGTVHITGTKTRPELYCYVNDSHDETSIIRRDISIVQLGSRFRVSFSPKNDTFSIRSLLDESVCFRKKMLFDTQSLQVNYVNPVNDQIVSNVIREQILEELKRKVLEVEKNSSSKVGVLLQKLNAIYPEKTLALKNMDMRALGSDDHELLRCSRLRAEIEWLHFRLEVSREALLGLKHSIAKDETVLEKLRNNLQICSSKDELSRNVQALQTELDHLPAAEVIAETIDNHIQLVKDETDLERQILDLEIEELRLELRLTKTKSKKFREETIRLNGLANTYEMNYTQFRAIIREIQDSDSCEL